MSMTSGVGGPCWRGEPSGKRSLGLPGHATIAGEAASQGCVTARGGLL
jgi:hypothetical protein